MGKKRLQWAVQDCPPHRGSVILTDRTAAKMKLMTAVGMLTGMVAELAPNHRPTLQALAKVGKAAARQMR